MAKLASVLLALIVPLFAGNDGVEVGMKGSVIEGRQIVGVEFFNRYNESKLTYGSKGHSIGLTLEARYKRFLFDGEFIFSDGNGVGYDEDYTLDVLRERSSFDVGTGFERYRWGFGYRVYDGPVKFDLIVTPIILRIKHKMTNGRSLLRGGWLSNQDISGLSSGYRDNSSRVGLKGRLVIDRFQASVSYFWGSTAQGLGNWNLRSILIDNKNVENVIHCNTSYYRPIHKRVSVGVEYDMFYSYFREPLCETVVTHDGHMLSWEAEINDNSKFFHQFGIGVKIGVY